MKKLVDIRKVGEKEACEFVREILDYNPSTGVLTWKVRDHKWSHATHFNSRFAGKRVDSIVGLVMVYMVYLVRPNTVIV